MKILKAKRRKEIEGREKPLWIDAAYTLIIGEREGRTTYTLIDERSGDSFPMFVLEKKQDSGGGGSYDRPEEDAVPF
jgi:hypothetical protein